MDAGANRDATIGAAEELEAHMPATHDKSVNIWMPLYTGDFLRDTQGMSTEEVGALVLLYVQFWTKGTLDDNDDTLSRTVRLSLDRWKAVKSVLMEPFRLQDGRWKHDALEAEHLKWTEYRRNRSEAGRKGAAARYGSKPANEPQSTG